MTGIRRFAFAAGLVAVAVVVTATEQEDSFLMFERLRTPPGASSQQSFPTDQGTLATRLDDDDLRERYRSHRLEEGEPFAKLTIPSLGVNLIVIEGVSGRALRAGAGHYPDTGYPGLPGNVGIAGHRTGFGAPFAHLDRLKSGDIAILESPEGRFEYALAAPFDGHDNPWITEPLDWTVIAPTRDATVTLTTDHPPETSRERLVARFVLRSA